MASSMSLCYTPNPTALARSNTHNTRRPSRTNNKPSKPPKLNKQIRKYAPPPEPVLLPGGEATTYTRLPPKDDFSAPSFSASTSELKLSDSTPPTLPHQTDQLLNLDEEDQEEIEPVSDAGFRGNYRKTEAFKGNRGSELEDEAEDEEEAFYAGFRGNYRKVEVFEENGGYLFEDEDEDDEEEAFEGGFQGNYRTLEVFEGNGGSQFEDEDDEDDEDEDESFELMDGKNVNFDDDNEEGESTKEKGVPAVMRCFDRAKIFVKAGDGGNGVVAFRREKFVPLGGPSGGDGGRGGNVYVEVDGSMNSLLPFRNSVHFRAGRGDHGQGKMMSGAKGEDVVIKVAPGTLVREAGKDEVLLEMVYPGQRALLLPGGRGGRGNASFKSGNNKVPRIAENGEEGAEM